MRYIHVTWFPNREKSKVLKAIFVFCLYTTHSSISVNNANWSIEGILTLSNTNQDSENLTNKDVLIFMGGTNDVHKNNSINGLRYISHFVNKNTQTNLLC
jgi:hypothetical protein